MKTAATLFLVAALSAFSGYAACYFFQLAPLKSRAEGVSTFSLELQKQASQADSNGTTYDNAALAHNMLVIREILSGRRDPHTGQIIEP